MLRRDLLAGAARTAGVLALGGLGAAAPAVAAPLSAAPAAAGADLALKGAAATPGLASALQRALQVCTPGDALERLLAGNMRFAAAWARASGQASAQERMAALQTIWGEECQIDPLALAEGQRPFAALLCCADSRVDPAWLFACAAGELFEVRSAGNTAFPEAIGSLEYAVGELGVPLLLVLGHSGCGGVRAALGDAPLTPMLEQLVAPIRATLVSGDDLSQAVQRNTLAVAAQLAQRSELIGAAVTAGRLTIRSAYCDLGSGHVSLL